MIKYDDIKNKKLTKSNRFAPKDKSDCLKVMSYLVQKYAILNGEFADWLFDNNKTTSANNRVNSEYAHVYNFLLYLSANYNYGSLEPNLMEILNNILNFFINGQYKITINDMKRLFDLEVISINNM